MQALGRICGTVIHIRVTAKATFATFRLTHSAKLGWLSGGRILRKLGGILWWHVTLLRLESSRVTLLGLEFYPAVAAKVSSASGTPILRRHVSSTATAWTLERTIISWALGSVIVGPGMGPGPGLISSPSMGVSWKVTLGPGDFDLSR